MIDYRKQVEEAIAATTLHSSTTYSWFGKRDPRLPQTVRRELTPNTARSYLLYNLRSLFYDNFYCKGFAAPPPPTEEAPTAQPAARGTPLVQELATANCGTGRWSDGWEVRMVRDDEVTVRREGLELRARPQEYWVPPGGQIVPGARLRLRLPHESLQASPGFYVAFSNKELPPGDSRSLVRLYWNLDARGVVRFMREATALLNEANLPFNLKVLHDPALCFRCDAGVVYVDKTDYDAVSQILATIYPEIATSLKPETPAFTKPLAPGVGLAEDPGKGESFGSHRCRLLADGMIRAYEQRKKSQGAKLEVVARRFEEEGISLEEPYLNPGSSDVYSFRSPRRQRMSSFRANTLGRPRTHLGSDAFLSTAEEIGQRLSREAVWHEDRCNWLGAAPQDSSGRNSKTALTFSALEPTLYSGTSGVALFLTELWAAGGDATVRRTALGAIRQALSRVDVVPPSIRLGFYDGWTGMALAAAHVGMRLDEAEPMERASRLIRRSVDRECPDKRESDLMYGKAGAIVALVILQEIWDDASLLDSAVWLGDDLLRAAERTDAGYSWASVNVTARRNFTGFSHGSAGVGYALLELFRATGDFEYRRAAESAFQYTRSETGKRSLPFAAYWCHGAPGIALSRLRAYQVLEDATSQIEAIDALQATHEMTEAMLRSRSSNYSLCHGLAGNAEVLLYGSEVLGQGWKEEPTLALEVAKAGIDAYARRGLPWPCGTGTGETPNLFVGLAGIGYFYLRLYNPTIPSVLIPHREGFANGVAASSAQPASAS
jgi:Lanthionine synthetase C-like protein/HopA1 effector protein family